MAAVRRAVIVALLAIWLFPSVSVARPEPTTPAAPPQLATVTRPAGAGALGPAEAAELGARERQAQDLQDWRGGDGVLLYVGSGLLLVLIVVLLLVII